MLDPIYSKLLCIQLQNERKGVYHPKVVTLKKIVLKIRERNKNAKILVLFTRYFENIAPKVKIFLGKDIRVNYYPRHDFVEEDYKEIFISSAVVLGKESTDLLSCPWKIFNHIIQYEFRQESNWHEIAYANNPNLIFTSFNALPSIGNDFIQGINTLLIFL